MEAQSAQESRNFSLVPDGSRFGNLPDLRISVATGNERTVCRGHDGGGAGGLLWPSTEISPSSGSHGVGQASEPGSRGAVSHSSHGRGWGRRKTG
ncbi:MAG: hypothetical protein RLZZ253_2577 [Verrucomicrobiota bacterium]